VVDGKVKNRELVLRSAEREHAKGGIDILLLIRTEVLYWLPSSPC
jgi:hypothetical protein